MIDPDVQPLRLARAQAAESAGEQGEAGSSAGCAFRSRCPYAIAACAERAPPWEVAPDGRHVACHRFQELADGIL